MFKFKKTSKYLKYIGTSFSFKSDMSTIYNITATSNNGEEVFLLNNSTLFLRTYSFFKNLEDKKIIILNNSYV